MSLMNALLHHFSPATHLYECIELVSKHSRGVIIMSRHSEETVGVRYTGWAALHRDPQEDMVEFVCPHCGHRGAKSARHDRALYHFTDGFLQDIQGEMTTCRNCRKALHLAPVVLLHDRDEKRRFAAVFAAELTSLN